MNTNKYNGFINIYKEPGWTSMDVVARLRRILGMKKIGHTGTLDPNAEGVLPVALGRATRAIDAAGAGPKTYEACMILGRTTDTQDVTGTETGHFEGQLPEEDRIREACLSFIGSYEQLTPMYSARKINGKKLYEYARAGKEVERPRKTVDIYELTVLSVQLPEVRLRVTCSKGTYIRTLCTDIGEKLGCGACMGQLIRTEAAGFCSEKAYRLQDVEAAEKEGFVDSLLCVKTGTALAFGNFDGTHKGHRYLVSELKKTAQAMKLKSCVVILDTGHRGISDAQERKKQFYEEDVDYCFILKLDTQLMNKSAGEFIEEILKGKFCAEALVGGTDISFGKGREGNALFLKEHASEYGLKVRLIEKLKTEQNGENIEISSTLIRGLLEQGHIDEANQLLY